MNQEAKNREPRGQEPWTKRPRIGQEAPEHHQKVVLIATQWWVRWKSEDYDDNYIATMRLSRNTSRRHTKKKLGSSTEEVPTCKDSTITAHHQPLQKWLATTPLPTNNADCYKEAQPPLESHQETTVRASRIRTIARNHHQPPQNSSTTPNLPIETFDYKWEFTKSNCIEYWISPT